ncbi:hypothetical protein KY285_015635 [Solanum tuberosum]|nr:hypothetical protein KY285_015635 [Solanum tuberosum]
MGNWENNQDALQMAILYFLYTFILAQTGDSSISVNEFLMVEDGRYQVYPWGKIAFTKLMDSLRQDFNLSKQLYRTKCHPFAIGGLALKPKFEMLMTSIFQENACSNIVPTPEELVAFDLPEDEHDPPSSPTTTSVNPKIVQPNDIVDFDDFSTRPPEQLLRRLSRVSDTSSPPPPKRRKKVDTSETKVSEPNGPPTPAANVHGSADAQKVNYVISDIEELKDHLKNYIDHTISNQHQMKRVLELQPTYESTHVDTEANDHKKVSDDEAHQAPQDLNEVNMDEDGADTVQHNIRHFMPFKITVDTSDSSTSTTISPSTQAAIDALVSNLGKVLIPVEPLCVYNPQDLTGSHNLLSDSQLPIDIPTTEIVVRSHSKTPAPRNKMPLRIIQSPYVTSFGSSEKGKHKLDDDYLWRRTPINSQPRRFSTSSFGRDEQSIEQEAERKVGWLLKLIFAGTATVIGYQIFPYMGDNLMQQSVSLLQVKDPLFKRMGASRLARFAIDDERRMKIVEIGGAQHLLNMLESARDDRTRKEALKALFAISKSDAAAVVLHQAGAISIIKSTLESDEDAEVGNYKSNLLSRFQDLSYDIRS